MKRKIALTFYIVRFLLIIAVGGVMTFFGTHRPIGNEEQVDFKGVNYLNATERFDAWASQNFGFRDKLVTANSKLKYNLFHQSAQQSVIAGREGWLFYESALHDYAGLDVLTDEEIGQVVENIKAATEAVEAQGAKAIWVIAPNKMEIYGEYMPYYYVENTIDGNYEKLLRALDNTNVMHTDLKTTLRAQRQSYSMPIYHKLDSHWNNIGAGIAYETIMSELELAHTHYSDAQFIISNRFEGDLYAMLFPKENEKDDQAYYGCMPEYEYTSTYRGDDDLVITAKATKGTGKILMFRDSFGNALHSFFAADFAESTFLRAIPYDVRDVDGADVVVFEIVERNIPNLLKYPPVTR